MTIFYVGASGYVVRSPSFSASSSILGPWGSAETLHGTFTYLAAELTYSAGAFSGLLAYGIGQLDGTWGYRGVRPSHLAPCSTSPSSSHLSCRQQTSRPVRRLTKQWRFIYIIEGIVSLVLALVSYFWIQNKPAEQGKWLAPEEQRYLVLRSRFMYGAARAGTGSKDEFNWHAIAQALKVCLSFPFHGWQLAALAFTLCNRRPAAPTLPHRRESPTYTGSMGSATSWRTGWVKS